MAIAEITGLRIAQACEAKVRRLPVVSRDKRLVGIISLGDIALTDDPSDAAIAALCGVSEPGGEHSQTTDESTVTSLGRGPRW